MVRKSQPSGEAERPKAYDQLVRRLSRDVLHLLVRDAPDHELAKAAVWELRRRSEHPSGKIRSNADRVRKAEPALSVFISSHGIQDEDVPTQVGDLICDVLHLCEARGGDPFRALRQGIGNYAAEIVCEDGLGPDFYLDIKLNGLEPTVAIEEARRRVEDLGLN